MEQRRYSLCVPEVEAGSRCGRGCRGSLRQRERREKLNKSDVSRCWRELGGYKRRDGSSASLSVSPAQMLRRVVRKRRPGVASRRRGPRRCIWSAGRLPRRFHHSLVESW